jgi:Tfp pilus assembly protein PilO
MTWWAFFAVVAFGLFGIRPLYYILKEKKELISEMEATNEALAKNIEDLKVIEYDLIEAGESLDYLNEYMPESFVPEDFLLDLSFAVSRVDYTVERYAAYRRPTEENENELWVNVRIEGEGDTADLIRAIESLKRLTTVRNFRYTVDENEEEKVVRLGLVIYSIGEPLN